VRHITKSDNQVHILHCEVILCPLIGHLNKNKNARGHFQQDGATVHIREARVFTALLCDMATTVA
jgi:hypothetical protein